MAISRLVDVVRTDKPLFVMITDPEAEAALPENRRKALRRKRLADDDLYIALQWFKPVTLPLAELTEDERKTYTRRGMGWLVLAPSGEILMQKRGDTASKTLIKMADKSWAKYADERLSRKRAVLSKLLDEMQMAEDAIATVGKRIETITEQQTRRPTPSNARSLKKAQGELAEHQAKLTALGERRGELVAMPKAAAIAGD